VGAPGHAGRRHRVVVLVLLLLTACSGSSATSKNQAYFNEVKTVLSKSDAAGAQLHDLLNSQQPVKLKQVQSRLTKMRSQAQSAVTAATSLKPTKQVDRCSRGCCRRCPIA
jgi:hypothetical protein